jgi:hypothetical protein
MPDDLGIVLGVGEETQALVINGMEQATESDWFYIDRHLEPAKVKGRSLVLSGTSALPCAEFESARARIARQGLYVEAKAPNGDLGRRYLAEWFADEAKVTVQAAKLVCQSLDYSLELILWTLKRYLAVSSKQELPLSQASKLLDVATPVPPTGDAFWLTLQKHPKAVQVASSLDSTETKHYLQRLESAITDMELIYPVLGSGATYKVVSEKTGLHIVRVIELADYVVNYPPSSVFRCREALDIGFSYPYQKESAKVVALLWT